NTMEGAGSIQIRIMPAIPPAPLEKLHAQAFSQTNGFLHIFNLKGDVMDSLALLIQSLPPHAWFFIRLDQLHLQVIIIEKGLPASGPGGSSQIQGASFFIFAGLANGRYINA